MCPVNYATHRFLSWRAESVSGLGGATKRYTSSHTFSSIPTSSVIIEWVT